MYQTEFDGQHYELGTSGFLYRSNKLMYDHETRSLWSTLQGEPVVGPLVDQNIKLNRYPVVTTTWGEWKKRHPESTVLSIDTGVQRDYGEGVAYKDYFATDDLMFQVPATDNRLKNKDEVVVISHAGETLAVSADFLSQHPVYQDVLGLQRIVILTDPSGANRVYDSGTTEFTSWDGSVATASDGSTWKMTEESLLSKSSGSESKILMRIPSHRVFWFGWYAQFPETRLVK